MNIYIDERLKSDENEQAAGSLALYIDGDFQFDTADEALYHESLALPALCLAKPANRNGLKILICGGGDGLALRECVRFPGVKSIDLVDYSEEIVELGKTTFADTNQHAFEDSRVKVHIQDAWLFLKTCGKYDVIICDFTVPRKHEDTRVFSVEWFGELKAALSPGGCMGINAVSPQITPEAFWCLNKTVKASGLKTLPYRVCIPSFREHGYGAWAFMLAQQPTSVLTVDSLRDLTCPLETRQADLGKLWRGARFKRSERSIEKTVHVNSLMNGCLLGLLMNPGSAIYRKMASADITTDVLNPSPYDLDPLLQAIPISHPYHTRVMIETLAEEVAGTIHGLDIKRLIDSLMRRAAELPTKLMSELRRLKEYVAEHSYRFELFGEWSYKLFAALVIMMTIANAISPDNAFAKGSFGGSSHGGVSVGHSSGRGGSSFGGSGSVSSSAAGSVSGGRSSSGSFSGSRGASFGGSRSSGGSFGSRSGGSFGGASSPHFTGSGFRSSYGQGHAVDISGSSFPSRTYYYGYYYHGYGYGYGSGTNYSGGNTSQQAPPEKHDALFLASEDMSVLDNGDVVVNISSGAYLLLSKGTTALMSNTSPEPLMLLYSDPDLFANVLAQINNQGDNVEAAIDSRQDWLSWVGWTSALMPAVRDDKKEVANLEDLDRRLHLAVDRLGAPRAGSVKTTPKEDQIELFIGAVLLPDGTISLRSPSGAWINTDGKTMVDQSVQAVVKTPCPPALMLTLRSAISKVEKDIQSGMLKDTKDLDTLQTDRTSLNKDLVDYQTILSEHYNDDGYQVDYGTEEISVGAAIRRTKKDLYQNDQDKAATQSDYTKLENQLKTVNAASRQFGLVAGQ